MKWVAENDGYRLTVEPDQQATNPRDQDNLGTMYCWHTRYVLGDKPNIPDLDILDEVHEDPDVIALPIFMREQVKIHLKTSPFSGSDVRSDTGPLGCICAERGAGGLDDGRIREKLQAEVEMYDLYLRNEVYRSVSEEKETCGECGHTEYIVVDSRGGFSPDPRDEARFPESVLDPIRDHLDEDVQGLVGDLQVAEELT